MTARGRSEEEENDEDDYVSAHEFTSLCRHGLFIMVVM